MQAGNRVPERMELARVQHDPLSADEQRVFVPRHDILQRLAALVWLDEIIRLAGQSASRDILDGSARDKSSLEQLLKQHRCFASLASRASLAKT
jgi:hypothetical protein